MENSFASSARASHMIRTPLEFLTAAGSWYDIGRAHGEKYRSLVRFTLNYYDTVPSSFHANSALWDHFDEAVKRCKQFVEQFPEYLEQIRGAADGAGVDPDLLLLLNFQSVLPAVSNQNGHSKKEVEAENCSNVIFPKSEFGPLIGGNCDCLKVRSVLHAKPTHGHEFIALLWPGMPHLSGWGGMNSSGLAVCSASAPQSLAPQPVMGLDVVNPNLILLARAATVDEAIGLLELPSLNARNNFMLLDASGRGVQILGMDDFTGKLRIRQLQGDEGLCHGNCFPWELSADKTAPSVNEGTAIRYRSLLDGLQKYRGNYSVAAMKDILTRHPGDPAPNHAVCNNSTAASMIASPSSGKIWFAPPLPCIMGYTEYAF